MTKCKICGLDVENHYNFSFAIAHCNCTTNLDKQNTEKDFAKLIVEDVETIYDVNLMRLNIKCVEKYLKNKRYSVEFINKVKDLCTNHINKLKSKKEIEMAEIKILKILKSFSDEEKNKILDSVKYR